MASGYNQVYCVREIVEDIRTPVAICPRCEAVYELSDIGEYCEKEYCKIQDVKISKTHNLPKDLDFILDGFIIEEFDFVEDRTFLAFGKKIVDYSWTGSWMGGCHSTGKQYAHLPFESEIKKWKRTAAKAGIRFVKHSRWRLIVLAN